MLCNKTKTIQCSQCGANMEVHIYAHNTQLCSKCKALGAGKSLTGRKVTEKVRELRTKEERERIARKHARESCACEDIIVVSDDDSDNTENEQSQLPYDRQAMIDDFMGIGFVFSEKERCILKNYGDDRIIIDARSTDRFVVLYSYLQARGARTGNLIYTVEMLNPIPRHIRRDILSLVRKYGVYFPQYR